MRPRRPRADDYDNHYQIKPHFVNTPGLTVIPESSCNYSISRHLKRKIGALYRKYEFDKCPNHGLFWASYPKWTMIEDRDKMVLLVVELKEKDLDSWWRIDDEVRAILDEYDLTDRGVCVRYYKFWAGRADEERRELRNADRIRRREQELAEQEEVDNLPALTEQTEQFRSPNLTVSTVSEAFGAINQLARLRPQNLEFGNSGSAAPLLEDLLGLEARVERVLQTPSPLPLDARNPFEIRPQNIDAATPAAPLRRLSEPDRTGVDRFGRYRGLGQPWRSALEPS